MTHAARRWADFGVPEPTRHPDWPEIISADHRRLDEPRRAARSGTQPDAAEDALDGSARALRDAQQ
jgi:hypothetical protein